VLSVECCVLFLNTGSVHGFPFFFSFFFFFKLFFLCLIGKTVFCFYTLYFWGSGGSVQCTDLFFFIELFFTF
jgi:hypothetical protein